jgi:hypothetical protein
MRKRRFTASCTSAATRSSFVREREPLHPDRWVPAAEVKKGLDLNLVAVPKSSKQYGEKGWLFATLARMLEDEGRLEYRREGSRSYCRSIQP